MEFLSGRHVAQERLKVDTAVQRQIKQAVCVRLFIVKTPAVMITGFLTADILLLCRRTFLPKTFYASACRMTETRFKVGTRGYKYNAIMPMFTVLTI